MTPENKQCESCADKNRLSDVELFKIAKETRDLEIKLFWQRTNYFLLLNSAVGGAFLYFFSKSNGECFNFDIAAIMLVFCGIGAFVCFAWMKICLGGRFWQVHWEQVLVDLQPKVGLTCEMDIFSDKLSRIRVTENLNNDSWYKPWYNRCVLRKPSVSGWMFITACFFFVVWLGAGIYSGCIIYKYAC